MCKTILVQFVAMGVLLPLNLPAAADFIPIKNPPGNEFDHAEIIEAIYSPGKTWSFVGGRGPGGADVDLSNGTLTAFRVDDFNTGGVLDVNTGSAGQADDILWTGGPLTVTAKARFAGYSQKLGYSAHPQTGSFTELFTVAGSGMAVSGSAVLNLEAGSEWTWVRGGAGTTFFGDPQYNLDGKDHLITYQVVGLNDGLNRWMLFWEDLNDLGDHDYNDFAAEVSAPIPEPMTVLLLALGCAAAIRR